MREYAGVFLVEKPGKDTQRLIIDARVSNMHLLPPPGVSLVTSQGLSRVEVALENDDEDPGELSNMAGLHLGLVAVKDAFQRFTISKMYSSFFALAEVRGEEVGSPLVGRVCPCFSSLPMSHTWSLFFCQNVMWATPGLEKTDILQDTRSCVVPRPSDENDNTESSHRTAKRFVNVYVDNLGVLGTSRVKVDGDLAMAVQTLKNRGVDTHEEAVHSNMSTPLGIHIDLRNMLVSVAPMRLWRLKQGLRWALRCRALPGKTWEMLLGHMTFVALLRRVLSVPFELNKFIRVNFIDSAKLWPGARAEVQAFVGLLPAIVSSWTRGWYSSVVATDASELGFCVCLKKECK